MGFGPMSREDRQPGKVRHTLEDLLAQRICGLADGHPNANDADRSPATRSTSSCSGATPSTATQCISLVTVIRSANSQSELRNVHRDRDSDVPITVCVGRGD
jgi:hypothetical protein